MKIKYHPRIITKCDHKRTKLKLVVYAFNCRLGRDQYFNMVRCCADCGCIVNKDSI